MYNEKDLIEYNQLLLDYNSQYAGEITRKGTLVEMKNKKLKELRIITKINEENSKFDNEKHNIEQELEEIEQLISDSNNKIEYFEIMQENFEEEINAISTYIRN